MTQKPVAHDLSVVIPTVGRDLLQGCLESIRAGTVWPHQLLIVDQSSTLHVHGWIATVRASGLDVVHIRSPGRGIANATNRGLERVTTPFVATTHDDCRVQADWLEKIGARLRAVEDAIVTGRVEPEGGGIVLTTITRREPAVYRKPMIDRDVLFPPNMGFPISTLQRIGYFDEHPSLRLAGEDNDWGYRALTTGVAIVYDPRVVVRHVAWQHPARLVSLYRRYARGQGSFYGKHLRRGDLFIARRALRDLVRAPWLLIRGAVTGNRQLMAMGLGEVSGLLPGLVAGLGNRGRSQGKAGSS